MGTRGLRIVVFRGRYFIYYNNYDSYPRGLGEAIVCDIPTDPEQYQGNKNSKLSLPHVFTTDDCCE
jgi:hypothetical protein